MRFPIFPQRLLDVPGSNGHRDGVPVGLYDQMRGIRPRPWLPWYRTVDLCRCGDAAFPLIYAAIENDLRRVLAYSLNNQLGFMVVGVGVGSALAINGVAAHALAYFEQVAAVQGDGSGSLSGWHSKGLNWGGRKSMPLTTIFCIIGAASIHAAVC